MKVSLSSIKLLFKDYHGNRSYNLSPKCFQNMDAQKTFESKIETHEINIMYRV